MRYARPTLNWISVTRRLFNALKRTSSVATSLIYMIGELKI